jgi:hypothetical protein
MGFVKFTLFKHRKYVRHDMLSHLCSDLRSIYSGPGRVFLRVLGSYLKTER